MDLKAKQLYDAHQKELAIEYGVIETAKFEGKEIGREEGKEIGREEGKEIGRKEGKEIGREEGKELGIEATICTIYKNGMDIETIAKMTNSERSRILEILIQYGFMEK